MTEDAGRTYLVSLLRQAAHLEHALLNAYLYAAATLKSTPEEFETIVANGVQTPCLRAAVQFERARRWKATLFEVAREEMVHLHLVQCLLRALGQDPEFKLPEPEPKGWKFPHWQPYEGHRPQGCAYVPLAPFSASTACRFVVFESADAVQEANPLGLEMTALFDELSGLEHDLFVFALLSDADADVVARVKPAMDEIYCHQLPTGVAPEGRAKAPAAESFAYLWDEDLRFQSISDLYRNRIAPAYEKAFERKWVTDAANYDLNREFLDPDHAGEGFLAVGPIYRDFNFERRARGNLAEPLANYKRLCSIIDEIVSEGEGFADFEGAAGKLLASAREPGQRQELARLLHQGQFSPGTLSPDECTRMEGVQLLRVAHLYRFAMVAAEVRHENDLAAQVGATFQPARTPLPASEPTVNRLKRELPAQFNACYLTLLAWLSRIYERENWGVDQPRRHAIEMLASWPLMSMAIRPLLELAGLVGVEPRGLFRDDRWAMPEAPPDARLLADWWSGSDRAPEDSKTMDQLAVHTLSGVAGWARDRLVEATGLERLGGGNGHLGSLVTARLAELSRLDLFQAQFDYRVAGGYSDRPPKANYRRVHREGADFEEDPSTLDPLFEATVVLRLRFAGWGLVQLATDPDPPFDEAGCTGTLLLHPSDRGRRFDRSLVWQHRSHGNTILRRSPREIEVGVRVVGATVMATDRSMGDTAVARYREREAVATSAAARLSDVNRELSITGLVALCDVELSDLGGRILGIDLLARNGQRPFLNGLNHIVSRDGEAIDPFVLGLVALDAAGREPPEVILTREVFNHGRPFLDMSAYQQLLSSRRPCGSSPVSAIPEWAQGVLPRHLRAQLGDGDAFAQAYLAERMRWLAEEIDGEVSARTAGGAPFYEVVSLAERLSRLATPRATIGQWIKMVLNYGHTLSGQVVGPANGVDALLRPAAEKLGAQVGISRATDDRSRANSRWLVRYSLGVMDTDVLSNLVFGEVFIPLTVQP